MISVTVAVTVGENSSEGSLIQVLQVETIPVNHDDVQGLWLAVGAVIERLSKECTDKSKEQATMWARTAPT